MQQIARKGKEIVIMSRIHYAFNPEQGSYILASGFTAPGPVVDFCEAHNLVGYQAVSIDVMDASWRMIKAAIDNRNNNIQMEYLAEQARLGNQMVVTSAEANAMVDKTLAEIGVVELIKDVNDTLAGGDVIGMPTGSILTGPAIVTTGLDGEITEVKLSDTVKENLLKEAEIANPGIQVKEKMPEGMSLREQLAWKKKHPAVK